MTDLVKMLTEGETPETDRLAALTYNVEVGYGEALNDIRMIERRARALEAFARKFSRNPRVCADEMEDLDNLLAAIDEQRKPR